NEGLRIELTESASGVFFDSGSDRMSPDGSDLVKLLGQKLGKLPNTLAIEGHTDAKPYPPGAIYTNWELSSDRANCARRLMQNSGIRPDQITQVRGFAGAALAQTRIAVGSFQPADFPDRPIHQQACRGWGARFARKRVSGRA